TAGQGMEAGNKGNKIKVGSSEFVGCVDENLSLNTSVHISTNDEYKGRYTFYNEYREGMQKVSSDLEPQFHLSIVSGDNAGEKSRLEKILPAGTIFLFNQKPKDKLNYIKSLQAKGYRTIMVGDGLNDAGALAQSDVGIAVSENVN